MIRKKSQRVNFVQKTYDEMYSARNDFLHGNPVRDNTLFPAGDLQYYLLTTSAVLVYKCALLVFLGMFERLRTEKGSWRYDFESTLRTLRQPREGL